MNILAIKNLLLSTLLDFGNSVLILLSAFVVVSLAFFVFRMGWHFLQGTSFIGWAWLDRQTYKPYKNYNRLRSRKWNLANTADL